MNVKELHKNRLQGFFGNFNSYRGVLDIFSGKQFVPILGEEHKRIEGSNNSVSMAKVRVIFFDFVMSFMWVISGSVIKVFVFETLGLAFQPKGEIVKGILSVMNMFIFSWSSKTSKGAAYNPLTVFSGAVSGDFQNFLFTLCVRIPAQVVGSIAAVKCLIVFLPAVGHGPRLNIDVHKGALTEGLLAFTIASVSLGLTWKDPNNFFIKTWVSSIAKLTLHILGSDLTGGVMNPASAMGWAFARGDHITKEHLVVYWLAPFLGALLAILSFRFFFGFPTNRKLKKDTKRD